MVRPTPNRKATLFVGYEANDVNEEFLLDELTEMMKKIKAKMPIPIIQLSFEDI